MILILEEDEGHPGRWATRIVLKHDEPFPKEVADIREKLQRGVIDLPKSMRDVSVYREEKKD